jgi:hypothetical protein
MRLPPPPTTVCYQAKGRWVCVYFSLGLLKTLTSELLDSVGDLVKLIGWCCKAARDVLVVFLYQAVSVLVMNAQLLQPSKGSIMEPRFYSFLQLLRG